MLASYALLLPLMTIPTQASQAAPPPKPFDCTAPEHRQFDFWVGEWDVVPNNAGVSGALGASGATSAGRKPAVNIIEKAHKGCVIVENWDDGIGGTGQSFNVYDRAKKRWQQTWVDSNGGLHEYWGELRDGNMVYIGDVPLPPASRFQGRRTVRLTFFPLGPDKVRQFSESLNVDGTWSVNYDLIYTRRAKLK
jgi:hypothetical protein